MSDANFILVVARTEAVHRQVASLLASDTIIPCTTDGDAIEVLLDGDQQLSALVLGGDVDKGARHTLKSLVQMEFDELPIADLKGENSSWGKLLQAAGLSLR